MRCWSILLAWVCWAVAVSAAAEVVRLGEAEVVVTRAGVPPADAIWRAVSLPDRWAGPRDAEPEERWYRMRVDLPPDAAGRHAVVLHDVAMNAEVRWNGEPLGDGGRFGPRISQNFGRPLRFAIPASLARPGQNELVVRVATSPHFYGWLGRVEVGPDAELTPSFEREMWWRHEMPQATTILGLVVVLLATAFFVASRETVYAWFGAWILLSSFADLNLYLRDPPLPTMAWARCVQWAVASAPLVFVVFAHRLVDVARPRVERVLAVGFAASFLLAVLVPDAAFLPRLRSCTSRLSQPVSTVSA